MRSDISLWCTPEYYQKSPHVPSTKVKALFFSHVDYSMPQVITDDPKSIIEAVFKNEKPYCIYFDKYFFHIYVSYIEQSLAMVANKTATLLFRTYLSQIRGKYVADTIYGHALVFGSMDLRTHTVDNKDHSVPYHLIEESLNAHIISQCH